MPNVHIPIQAIKGRGISHQQAHRYMRDAREAFDDGWSALDEAAQARDDAPPPATEVTWEDCRSAITKNESPDVGFMLGLNPYRGCEHVMRHWFSFTCTDESLVHDHHLRNLGSAGCP